MDAAHDAVSQFRRDEYPHVLAQVLETWRDVRERARRLGGSVLYDPEDDWFILTIGEPGPAAILEASDDLWLRVQPDGVLLVGFEIPNLRAFLATHPEIAAKLAQVLAQANTRPGTYVHIPPSGQTAQVAEDLRDLLSA
jgi:hypothetical protein